MRILFDLVTPQYFVGGAGEYVRKVFYSVVDKLENIKDLYCLIDTRIKKYAYSDLSEVGLSKLNVNFIDIAKSSLYEIIKKNNIEKVFIGAAQYWVDYDIENISCSVICVVHDLCDEEYELNKLTDYVHLNSLGEYLRFRLHKYRSNNGRLIKNKKIFNLINTNQYAKLITVSNYSKYSIMYNYNIPESKIQVLYSPERIFRRNHVIENEKLRYVIERQKKYYLMLSANRIMKNSVKLINAFKIFSKNKDVYLITVGLKEKEFENHIVLPYLSESDLANAIRHCYAFVFPSYFEGFGYPPVEAMSYSKPIITSNVCSIPEIVGSEAIMFSPFYESDIFKALNTLKDSNYAYFANNSRLRFLYVSKKQAEDLCKLVSYILL